MDSPHVNKTLNKARQLMARRNFAEALPLYAGLVKQFPQGGGEYGRAAADAGNFALAYEIWEEFRARHPRDSALLARLADEYQTIGLHGQARELLATAGELEPRNLELQLKLAALTLRTNSTDAARPIVARCLELNPRDVQALYLSAHLDRLDGKLSEAEQKLRGLPSGGDYSCHAELAHVLDRTERFEDAMAVLEEGKALARRSFRLHAEREAFYERHRAEIRKAIEMPGNILSTWAQSFPAKARNSAPPVAFLSGCARSGTTLLEKILDAHPGVTAFDESPALKAILPQIEAAPPQRLNFLRGRYVNNLTLAADASDRGKLLLDKNPSRTIWLPRFLRLFPELRVLIALRDPRDVIVSLYFQDHERTNYLTLAELAGHYGNVMDVWLAARKWEGLRWLETRYEDIVADLPREGARVTAFLGLDWRPEQAVFFQSRKEKAVMSTNYAAVNQPVYARAVGRWRAYEKNLAPILPLLEPYCKTFGYA